MQKVYKVGDILPNGFEIVEVNLVPKYKSRRRIVITKGKLEGEEGWYYHEDNTSWINLDKDNDHRMRRIEDFEYI